MTSIEVFRARRYGQKTVKQKEHTVFRQRLLSKDSMITERAGPS